MIAAQLPDGASLGRTTAALDEATKLALDTPGVEQVIAISGLSALDNFADLANAGVSFVMLKPWDERSKATGTDILSIAEHLQKALDAAARRQAFRAAAAADPGDRQCRRLADADSSCSAAASIIAKLSDVTQQIVKQASADPAAAARADDASARARRRSR